MNRILSLLTVPFAVSLLGASSLGAASGVPQLSARYPLEWLQTNLTRQAMFHPYATIEERTEWNAVEDRFRTAIVSSASSALDTPWAALPATRYLDFVRDGNRTRFQDLYFGRRKRGRAFALAECLEDSGRFIDQIVNGVWLTCEESSWVLPAHIHAQRAGTGLPDVSDPTIDLFAAETGAQLAWIDYLLGPRLDAVSRRIRSRIRLEVDQRILVPFLERDDYSWMGFRTTRKLHNWTPWIVSNVLACALLIETDDARRAQIAHRCLQILDNYLITQTADGGCEEGPHYWARSAGSAFDALELLYLATDGMLDGYTSPKLQAMGAYIHRMHIAGPWFVNFADAAARPEIEGALCYRFGKRLDDPALTSFGAWFAQRDETLGLGRIESLGRSIPGILHSAEIDRAEASPPLSRDTWLPDLQVMSARVKAGSPSGLFVAAKGGNNAESHNHNDVGSCIVFADGRPVLIDSGPGSYTRKTFGEDRYDIWTMQSDFHNVPTINGISQAPGSEFRARNVMYETTAETTTFALDLAGAYPPAACVQHWVRQYVFSQPDRLAISDDYALTAATAPNRWHFLLPVEPEPSSPGRLILYGGSDRPVTLNFDPSLEVQTEAIATDDPPLRRSWGGQIVRMTLINPETHLKGSFTLTIGMD